MNKKKIISLIMTALILSSNSASIVKAESLSSVSNQQTMTVNTVAPLLSYKNLTIAGYATAVDITRDVAAIKALTEGTIVVKFDSTVATYQSLFCITNGTAGNENEYFNLFITEDKKVGYEIRRTGATGAFNENIVKDIGKLNDTMNILAFKADRDGGYALYLNGAKVYEIAKADAKFISDLKDMDTVYIGKGKRGTTNVNAWPFSGTIEFLNVYSSPLTNDQLVDLTTGIKPPSNLTYTKNSDNTTTLNWSKSNDESVVGYKIYNSNVLIQTLNSADITSYTDAGTSLSYRVASFNANGVESLSNLNPTVEPGKIPQSQIRITASTSQSALEGANMALDGDKGTIWHSLYSPTTEQISAGHKLTMELGKKYSINTVTYLPRQSGINGVFKSGYLEVSTNGVDYSRVPGSEFTNWANNASLKVISFNKLQANYVRIVATETYGDVANKYGTAAEVNVYGVEEVAPTAPSVAATSIGKNSATLKWNNPINSPEKIVKYILSADGVSDIEVNFNESGEYTQEITGLVANTDYNYKVKSIGVNGLASTETQVNFKTLKEEVAPTAPSVTATDVTENSLTLTWSNPTNSEEEIANYVVKYGDNEIVVPYEEGKVYSEVMSGLKANTEYQYTVTAIGKNTLKSVETQVSVRTLEEAWKTIKELAVSDKVDTITGDSTSVEINGQAYFKAVTTSDVTKLKFIFPKSNNWTEYYLDTSYATVDSTNGTKTWLIPRIFTSIKLHEVNVVAIKENEVSNLSKKLTVNVTNPIKDVSLNVVADKSEVNRFDKVNFTLTLAKDIDAIKVVLTDKNTNLVTTEYYGATSSEFTINKKFKNEGNLLVEFIPMSRGYEYIDNKQTVSVKVNQMEANPIKSVLLNGKENSCSINKVGDVVEFKIETTLGVEMLEFKFPTSNNYIEYYDTSNSVVEGNKRIWTINRTFTTLKNPHELVITGLNEWDRLASTNVSIKNGNIQQELVKEFKSGWIKDEFWGNVYKTSIALGDNVNITQGRADNVTFDFYYPGDDLVKTLYYDEVEFVTDSTGTKINGDLYIDDFTPYKLKVTLTTDDGYTRVYEYDLSKDVNPGPTPEVAPAL